MDKLFLLAGFVMCALVIGQVLSVSDEGEDDIDELLARLQAAYTDKRQEISQVQVRCEREFRDSRCVDECVNAYRLGRREVNLDCDRSNDDEQDMDERGFWWPGGKWFKPKTPQIPVKLPGK